MSEVARLKLDVAGEEIGEEIEGILSSGGTRLAAPRSPQEPLLLLPGRYTLLVRTARGITNCTPEGTSLWRLQAALDAGRTYTTAIDVRVFEIKMDRAGTGCAAKATIGGVHLDDDATKAPVASSDALDEADLAGLLSGAKLMMPTASVATPPLGGPVPGSSRSETPTVIPSAAPIASESPPRVQPAGPLPLVTASAQPGAPGSRKAAELSPAGGPVDEPTVTASGFRIAMVQDGTSAAYIKGKSRSGRGVEIAFEAIGDPPRTYRFDRAIEQVEAGDRLILFLPRLKCTLSRSGMGLRDESGDVVQDCAGKAGGWKLVTVKSVNKQPDHIVFELDRAQVLWSGATTSSLHLNLQQKTWYVPE